MTNTHQTEAVNVAEGQMVVIRVGGIDHTAIVREKWETETDGEFAFTLTTFGMMYFHEDEVMTVVDAL